MELNGIDVSHHNGAINWPRVAADGVHFAIIKAGNGSRKNTCTVDSRFLYNIENALEAGLDVGVYIASYAMEPEHAAQEATYFASLLEKYKGRINYPVYYDMEGEGSGGWYDQWSLGKETVSDICQAFIDRMTAAGWLTGLYINENWRRNRIRESLYTGYPLWLAHYASRPTYTGDIGIWQRTSTGKADGINGNVDVNVGYVGYPAIIKAGGWNGFAPDAPVPEPVPVPAPEPDKPSRPSVADQIERAYAPTVLSNAQYERQSLLRAQAKAFAHLVDSRCPDGRAKALALTKLEEAVFWANAAIAREAASV